MAAQAALIPVANDAIDDVSKCFRKHVGHIKDQIVTISEVGGTNLETLFRSFEEICVGLEMLELHFVKEHFNEFSRRVASFDPFERMLISHRKLFADSINISSTQSVISEVCASALRLQCPLVLSPCSITILTTDSRNAKSP